MTTQTLPHSATAPNTSAPLIKRIGRAAYRLLERMTERAYQQHKPCLRNNFYL
ncbi:hypothetical protein OCT51_19735 [Halomonas sp. LR3S48]|uniref:hypothetical protein n=1 Tax=Halomonas sp. LR3S48 TaxID=2982694 RepID=UPI0021E4507E|nr:hypothetical protein [Halomonas sp. LR3S48]UYG03388.1 hypothetical protein OCT51_19735 [Halomonas sp. LR3S48]